MACASSQALIAANTCCCTFPTQIRLLKRSHRISHLNPLFIVRASTDDVDCNAEECAPDKEVGKVSVEWLAGDKTKVVGTFPPKKKGWTGYVEKDTAGQTNIYSIEPAVYVAESAISSGTAGMSSDGSENTLGVFLFLGLISVAAASSILLQVGKNPPQIQTVEDYSGPSLSFYVNKFKAQEIVQKASEPVIEPRSSSSSSSSSLLPQQESSNAASKVTQNTIQVETEQPASSGQNDVNVS